MNDSSHAVFTLFACTILVFACKDSRPSSAIDRKELTRLVAWRGDGKDIDAELQSFYRDVRLRYNESQFDELEIIAGKIREDELKFSNSEWKIEHFYKTFTCRDDEPQSMWELHDSIHKSWIQKFPQSITAGVAYARFLTEYAWFARGDDYIDKVKTEDFALFQKRLAKADEILDNYTDNKTDCPMWSLTRMKIALGRQAEPAEFEKIFREAKAGESTFFPYDILRAYYLLPRWYGKEGEWEKAALDEIFLEDGGGTETYAKVLMGQRRFYGNIFEEAAVDWDKANDGFQKILTKDPGSQSILNVYCLMACFAGDPAVASELFAKIGNSPDDSIWRVGKHNIFDEAHQWAVTTGKN